MDEMRGGIPAGAKIFWFSATETMKMANIQRREKLRYNQGVDTYLYVEARIDAKGNPYLYFGWEAYPGEMERMMKDNANWRG